MAGRVEVRTLAVWRTDLRLYPGVDTMVPKVTAYVSRYLGVLPSLPPLPPVASVQYPPAPVVFAHQQQPSVVPDRLLVLFLQAAYAFAPLLVCVCQSSPPGPALGASAPPLHVSPPSLPSSPLQLATPPLHALVAPVPPPGVGRTLPASRSPPCGPPGVLLAHAPHSALPVAVVRPLHG